MPMTAPFTPLAMGPSSLDSLYRRARDGSSEALGELLDRYSRLLLAIANQKVDSDIRPKDGASDVVQETMLEFYREFDRNPSLSERECRARLYRTLKNNILNLVRHHRAKKRNVRLERSLDAAGPGDGTHALADDGTSASSVCSGAEAAEALREALRGLTKRERRVLLLTFYEGLNASQIGAVMDLSADNVRQIRGRAKGKLKHALARFA